MFENMRIYVSVSVFLGGVWVCGCRSNSVCVCESMLVCGWVSLCLCVCVCVCVCGCVCVSLSLYLVQEGRDRVTLFSWTLSWTHHGNDIEY